MHRARLCLRFAWLNLRGHARWTGFAMLGVAAGVAAMVTLRSLGLAVNDALLLNLRDINRGDVNVRSVASGPFAFSVNQGAWERSVFSPDDVQRITEAVERHEGRLTSYGVYHNVQITRDDPSGARPTGIISSFFIDPASWQVSHLVHAEEPAGMTPEQLLTGAAQVLLSRRLADALEVSAGDSVRVSGGDIPLRVTGILPDHSEANIRDLSSSFFGFAYFHRDQALQLQLNPAPNQISIRLPDDSGAEAIRRLGLELWSLDAGVHSMTTTPDLLLRNAALAEYIERFVVVTGLAALLIGGAGIVNTMLVLTGRRLQEIAALKTFGLRRRQIATIFGMEALLLGLAGSAVGMLAGLALSLVVNRFGEILVQRPLAWRLYPEALLFGLAMGLIVTVVFGILPVSVAARVRPAIILRPTQGRLPRAGAREVALALLLLTMVAGVITGQIIRPLLERGLPGPGLNANSAGILLVALALAVVCALTAALWLLLRLVSLLPPAGSPALQLALANLGTQRLRSAVTLLALGAGVFTLSALGFLGLGARQVLNHRFGESLGGNVLVLPVVQRGAGQTLLNLLPGLQEDIRFNTQTDLWFAQVDAIDGAAAGEGPALPLVVRRTQKPGLGSGELIAGRDLRPDDAGRRVAVVARGSALEAALRNSALTGHEMAPGAKLGLRVNGELLLLDVVGMVGSGSNAFLPGIDAAFLPPGLLDAGSSQARFQVLDVAPDRVDGVLARLRALPLLLALDVNFLDALIVDLTGQLGALPGAVGLLSLASAAVMMANTVMLATLERRRQTGVLRALGLRRGQVLRVMLIENLLLGLLGAAPGIALGMALRSLLTTLGTGVAAPSPPQALPLIVAPLLVVLLIAWLATLPGARSALKPSVMQVLRHE